MSNDSIALLVSASLFPVVFAYARKLDKPHLSWRTCSYFGFWIGAAVLGFVLALATVGNFLLH